MVGVKTVHLKTRRKLLSNSLLLVITLFLSSCSVPITCVLYNNTPTKVKVVRFDNLVVKESTEVMPGESIELEKWDYCDYQIILGNSTWRYDSSTPYIPYFDSNYVETTGIVWVKRLIFAQLEKDGRIFLLNKDQKFPIVITKNQPTGYPLIPY
jgi:hypothetical protein